MKNATSAQSINSDGISRSGSLRPVCPSCLTPAVRGIYCAGCVRDEKFGTQSLSELLARWSEARTRVTTLRNNVTTTAGEAMQAQCSADVTAAARVDREQLLVTMERRIHAKSSQLSSLRADLAKLQSQAADIASRSEKSRQRRARMEQNYERLSKKTIDQEFALSTLRTGLLRDLPLIFPVHLTIDENAPRRTPSPMEEAGFEDVTLDLKSELADARQSRRVRGRWVRSARDYRIWGASLPADGRYNYRPWAPDERTPCEVSSGLAAAVGLLSHAATVLSHISALYPSQPLHIIPIQLQCCTASADEFSDTTHRLSLVLLHLAIALGIPAADLSLHPCDLFLKITAMDTRMPARSFTPEWPESIIHLVDTQIPVELASVSPRGEALEVGDDWEAVAANLPVVPLEHTASVVSSAITAVSSVLKWWS